MMRQYCTVSRAYAIADEAMYELFLASSRPDLLNRWSLADTSARKAARWLICRGMARAEQGRLVLLETPTEWYEDQDDD